MRILILEDDTMIGEGLSRALVAEGMSVDWVRDGKEAETALRDGGHALVLLDLGLPGADGLDLLKTARNQAIDTPVLIITARDGLDHRVSGLDLGADDYLVKPFEIRELLARMRAVLRRRTGAGHHPIGGWPDRARHRDTPVVACTLGSGAAGT